MSRIGKKPIEIPKGVEVKVDGQTVTVKGPKGELTQSFDKDLKIELNDGVLTVERPNEIKKIKALHGLTRTLIYNMIIEFGAGTSTSIPSGSSRSRGCENPKLRERVFPFLAALYPVPIISRDFE